MKNENENENENEKKEREERRKRKEGEKKKTEMGVVGMEKRDGILLKEKEGTQRVV